LGDGCKALGLTGEVHGAGLKNLLRGYSPDGETPLTQNAGSPKHQPGWDLTFSAPKSVSVFWSQAGPEVRRAVQEAQGEAAAEAIRYLQDTSAWTRRGKGGRERERAGLVAAAFEHGTSRAQDPQLHTHCLILNVGTRADGTTGTIVSKPLYLDKLTAGAVYRAELSNQLEKRLGLALERRESWFEVRGVPESLVQEFSKRREEVERALAERGESGAKAAAKAALATRKAKDHLPRAELVSAWQDVGRAHGFSVEEVNALLQQQSPRQDLAARVRGCVRGALARLTRDENRFTERDLLCKAAEEAQARGIPVPVLRHAVKEALARSPDISCLGRVEGEVRYKMRETSQGLQGTKTLPSRPQAGKKLGAAQERESAREERAPEQVTQPMGPAQGASAGAERHKAAQEVNKTERGEPGLFPEAKAKAPARKTKDHPSGLEHPSTRQAAGRGRGASAEEVNVFFEKDPHLAQNVRACIRAALEEITRHESHFSGRDLERQAARGAEASGIPATVLRHAVKNALLQSPEIVRLGRSRGELRYTTREMLELEEKMLRQVDDLKALASKPLAEKAVRGAEKGLSDEQKRALRHVTQSAGSIQVVSGLAGTGKTSMLRAAREAFERQGFEVMGACLSGKAAQGLEEGAGIRSFTVARLLGWPDAGYKGDLEKGALDTLKHHAWQLARAALGKTTWREDRIRLTSKTVIVVDEAAMVGTRQIERLTEHALKAGARLILVGDEKQLQAISAGGPFASIGKRLGQATLTEIQRQKDPWAREAVKKLAHGKAREALTEYARRGLVSVADDREEAMRALLREWKRQGAANPKEHLILASTNADAQALNRMAQVDRMLAGQLGRRSLRVGAADFRGGDRVLFTRNSKRYGVENGCLGTVLSVDAVHQTMTVRLDKGRLVVIPTTDYAHMKLGYALTTHKSQGATTENAYVLLGPLQDRELSYVQASRARGTTRFFTDKREAGEDLDKLCRQMERSRQKNLAQDLLDRREREYGQRL
jgi:conjugative relaxase-like TrwC/TraI family protein